MGLPAKMRRPSSCDHRRKDAILPLPHVDDLSPEERPTNTPSVDMKKTRTFGHAHSQRRHRRPRPHTAGATMSIGKATSGTRDSLEVDLLAAQRRKVSEKKSCATQDGWMEAWISSALKARRSPSTDEMLEMSESADDGGMTGTLSDEDISTAALMSHGARTVYPVAGRAPFSRPRVPSRLKTAFHCQSHSMRHRPKSLEMTTRRPLSAIGVPYSRTAHGRRSSANDVGVRPAFSRGSAQLRRRTGTRTSTGSRKGRLGKDGDKASPARKCCRRVESAWSYRASGARSSSPRRILVKVPCVRTNGRGRRASVGYRLAWDGEPGESRDASDRRRFQQEDATRDRPDGNCADAQGAGNDQKQAVLRGSLCRTGATAFSTVACPNMDGAGAEPAGGDTPRCRDGSHRIAQVPSVREAPNTSRVMTQLRTSVARERIPNVRCGQPTDFSPAESVLSLSPLADGLRASVTMEAARAARSGVRDSLGAAHAAETSHLQDASNLSCYIEQRDSIIRSARVYTTATQAICEPEDSRQGAIRAQIGRTPGRHSPALTEYSFFPSPSPEHTVTSEAKISSDAPRAIACVSRDAMYNGVGE